MHFRVIAMQDGAATTTLNVEAADRDAAIRSVAARGLAVIDARPSGLGLPQFARRTDFALDVFCQELLALLSAGIQVGEALDTLARKETRPAQREVIAGMLEALREGKTLSAAMQARTAVFPALLTEAMRASERTSDYVPALRRFVSYRRLVSELRSKLVAAAIYPVILLSVSSLVLLFLVGYVVPRFAQVYADMGDRLPFASRVLLQLGLLIDGHPVAMGAGALAAALGLGFAASRPAMRARALGLVRQIPKAHELMRANDFARMYRTLAMLLNGGIPVVAALDVVRGLTPHHLLAAIDRCRRTIAEGGQFSQSMADCGLSSVLADRYFRVGEQTGRLGEMVDRAAEYHEEEVSRAADWIGRVVGPALMLLMGGVIGLVVVMLYMPIFQLADSVS